MRKFSTLQACLAAAALLASTSVFAVPSLQIGIAPGGNCLTGPYAPYQDSTNPTEDDTAISTGSTICVAGAYGPNFAHLGGQFGTGDNYSDLDRFDLPASFDSADAILVASVPEGFLAAAAGLTINGNSFFDTSTENLLTNNHAPTGSATSDFLYFDIPGFNNLGSVTNFADPADSEGAKPGQILTLTIAGLGTTVPWVHFDVLALLTTTNGNTFLDVNPGSHDATIKNAGQFENEVPEPSPLLLIAAALLAIGGIRARRSR